MPTTPRTMPHPTDHIAPPVSLEACVGFVAGPDGGPCCAECGWSADDHEMLVGAPG